MPLAQNGAFYGYMYDQLVTDLTVHNYNILNTAGRFQFVTVRYTPKNYILASCHFCPFVSFFRSYITGVPITYSPFSKYWGPPALPSNDAHVLAGAGCLIKLAGGI